MNKENPLGAHIMETRVASRIPKVHKDWQAWLPFRLGELKSRSSRVTAHVVQALTRTLRASCLALALSVLVLILREACRCCTEQSHSGPH